MCIICNYLRNAVLITETLNLDLMALRLHRLHVDFRKVVDGAIKEVKLERIPRRVINK